MPTTRSSNAAVIVDHDQSVSVKISSIPRRGSTSQRRRSTTSSASAVTGDVQPVVTSAVLDSLTDSGLIPTHVVDIAPAKASSSRRGGAAAARGPLPPSARTVRINAVPTAPGEQIVVLVESDGAYEWVLQPEGAEKGEIEFDIGGPEARAPHRRGLVGDLLWKPVKAFVLRFVADKVISAVTKRLEERTEHALLRLNQDRAWEPAGNLGDIDPSSRVLLFVHGTFSSTVGSFGHLETTEPGRRFLNAALAKYSAVIAFDHPTLACDSIENANKLDELLKTANLPVTALIDSIAYSRGGQVLREFIEHISEDRTFVRAVFFACTNGGTALADSRNWRRLLDIYTNLVAATGRAVGLIDRTWISGIVTEALKSLGELAKAIALGGLEEKKVPGLAAMQPNGDIIKRLNDASQPQLPPRRRAKYYVVTSDFEAELIDPNPSLTERLKLTLMDKGMDALMREQNDLVVDTESMSQFGVRQSQLVETKAWGTNGTVHHMNHFEQPDNARRLLTWLDLDDDAIKAKVAPVFLSHDVTIGELLLATETRDWDTPVIIGKRANRYLTVEAPHHIRIKADFARMAGMPKDGQVISYMNVSRNGAASAFDIASSADVAVGSAGAVAFDYAAENVSRVVLSPMSATDIAFLERVALGDESHIKTNSPDDGVAAVGPIITRRRGHRAKPPNDNATLADGPPPAHGTTTAVGTRPEEPASVSVELKVLAEMPSPAKLTAKTSLTVRLSRQEIAAAMGTAAIGASITAEEAEKITISVEAIANCEVVGKASKSVDVPGYAVEAAVKFAVQGLAPGPAEVRVSVSQKDKRLTIVALQTVFVPAAATVQAQAAISTKEIELPLVAIKIIEEATGSGRCRLRFIAESRDLPEINSWTVSQELNGSRAEYTADLYKQLENSWSQSRNRFENFMLQMQGKGIELCKEIIPESVAKLLWTYRDRIGSVEIISEEPFIPWEIVYLVNPATRSPEDGFYLAELGVTRWIANTTLPPSQLRIRPNKAFYVIPDYQAEDLNLANAQAEGAMLHRLFGAAPTDTQYAKLIPFIRSKDSFDLLHFACHGEADSKTIWNAGLLLERWTRPANEGGDYVYDYLMARDINTPLTRPDGARPIVFLNACQAGRAGKSLTGTGGLTKSFVEMGAGLLVSALWSIGDSPAQTFADVFYTALKSGETVRRAARKAREAAKERQDSTWLAYTIYGHPYARLSE